MWKIHNHSYWQVKSQLCRCNLVNILIAVMVYFMAFIGGLGFASLNSVADAAVVEQQQFSLAPKPRQFTIAIGKDSYPFQFANAEGKPDGLMVDLWRLWARKNQHSIRFVPSQWSDSLVALDNQSVDFHAALSIIEPRQQKYQMGPPLIAIHAGLFVHHQLNGISTLEDLRPYVIGVVEGAVHISALQHLLDGVHLKLYPTRDALYQAALAGEVRVFVGLNRLSARHPLFDKLSKMFPLYKKVNYQSFDLTYAINKQTPDKGIGLDNILQAGLAKISPEEIKAIEKKWLGLGADSDALVIALPSDRAPFMSVSATGEPTGLIVDIWRKWSEKTRRQVVFLTDDSNISMQNFIDKKADVHAAFADVSVNRNLFPHAHHIYSFNSTYYFPKVDGQRQVLRSDITNSKVGILAGSPIITQVEQQFAGVTLLEFDSYRQMIDEAVEGNVDGFFASEQIVELELIKHNLSAKFGKLENVRFENRMYSLVRQDNKVLVSQIKEGFSLISLDELREIEKQWIKQPLSQHFADVDIKVVLNSGEKSWLLRHPVIRLGALKDWAPTEFIDDKGNLIGVTADLISIIEKRAQISVEPVLFDEWTEIVEALKNKQIDMVASMNQSAEREAYASFTDEYWPQPWAVVTNFNQQSVDNLAELKGKRLAVVKGYQIIPYLHKNFPQILLQVVPDNHSGFLAVRNGQADGFIDGMANVASVIRAKQYQDLSFSLIDDVPPAMERIGVRNDWKPLVNILNKVIATISDDEKKAILEKWFELKVQSGIDRRKVIQFSVVAITFFIIVIWWNRRLTREVNKRRIIEKRMKHMATHDELTGLPNRVLLRERLTSAIELHASDHEQLALLFIDLDGFKDVNDTYGHDVGDELLIQISERFKAVIRRADIIARFGGDEFVVLLSHLGDKEQVRPVCEKLLGVIEGEFELSSCNVQVGASIGVAMYPADGQDDTQLMKVADTLMYEVKASGKNNYVFSNN